jgi:integral membrane protein (TIGR00529 family)
MLDLVKLGLILGLTILLLTRRWDLGLILLIDTVLLALLYHYPPLDTLRSIGYGLIDDDTLMLVGAVFLMLTLAELMRRTASMERMVGALQIVVPDSRIVLATIPALIGLMPMIGGAMFSAPMVNGISDRLKISPQRRTFINYWFRHAMEYVWPLYTSVLLTAALLEVTPAAYIRVSYPLTLTALAGGIVWGLVGLRAEERAAGSQSKRAAWRDLLTSIWPLLLVILLVVVLRLNMLLSLSAVIVLFMVVHRVGPRHWLDIAKHSLPLRTFSAILGVMIFKRVIEDAGAVQRIPVALGDIGLPPLLVAFLVPHLVGLLTGTPPAAVALSIPIVAPLMDTPAYDYIAGGVWMFVGAFSGVMLSPLHLCLALTREYFGARWGPLYQAIAPATAAIIAVALALVLLRS